MTLGFSNPNDAMDDGVIDPNEEMMQLAQAYQHAEVRSYPRNAARVHSSFIL